MTIRLEDRAMIPKFELAGVATRLNSLENYNATIEDIRWELDKFSIEKRLGFSGLDDIQIQQMISDLQDAGKLRLTIRGGSNVLALPRPAALAGGISGDSVFATISGIERPFEVWIFLNGVRKVVNVIPEGNSPATAGTTKTAIGAVSGDVVSWARVVEVDGVTVVGWMASAAVP